MRAATLALTFRRLKECKVDGQNVLLVKHKGDVHAIGARCTHLGAPLKNGVGLLLSLLCVAVFSFLFFLRLFASARARRGTFARGHDCR